MVKNLERFYPPEVANRVRTAGFMVHLFYKRYFAHKAPLTPIVAEMFLTQNCNLRCISCGCWRSRVPEELTCEEWMRIIDQLNEERFVKLNFTGGEPTLRDDFLEIVRYASKHTRASLHLNTNGTLLTNDTIQALIDAGVYSFNISIDGVTPGTHDSIRGQTGAFALTMQTIDTLIWYRDHYPLRLRICATITNRNLHELAAIAQMAQEKQLQLYLNQVTDHTFLFRASSSENLYAIDIETLKKSLEQVLVMKRKNPRYLPSRVVISRFADHFTDIRQKVFPCVESQLKLMIHSDGTVGGCWAEDPLESLRKNKLAEILASPAFKSRQNRLYWKECRGCGSGNALDYRLSLPHMIKELRLRFIAGPDG